MIFTALMIAASVGTVHALVTIYWAFGGSALLQTVGRDMVALFAGRRWLLLPGPPPLGSTTSSSVNVWTGTRRKLRCGGKRSR